VAYAHVIDRKKESANGEPPRDQADMRAGCGEWGIVWELPYNEGYWVGDIV